MILEEGTFSFGESCCLFDKVTTVSEDGRGGICGGISSSRELRVKIARLNFWDLSKDGQEKMIVACFLYAFSF